MVCISSLKQEQYPARSPRIMIIKILIRVYQGESRVISPFPLISRISSTNPKIAPKINIPIGTNVCERLKKFNVVNKPEERIIDNIKNKKTVRSTEVQTII